MRDAMKWQEDAATPLKRAQRACGERLNALAHGRTHVTTKGGPLAIRQWTIEYLLF
jgi:hypothetical protein